MSTSVQSVSGCFNLYLRDIVLKGLAWFWAQEKFFATRTMKQWNRVPKEAVLPPCNSLRFSRLDRIKS